MMMDEEQFEKKVIEGSYRMTCWKCDREMDGYMNDCGVDGSVATYCLDCYNHYFPMSKERKDL